MSKKRQNKLRMPRVIVIITLALAVGLLGGGADGGGCVGVEEGLIVNPESIRLAAEASDLEPLGDIPAPLPDLAGVVADNVALVQLGKALFWDQQIGSDGQSCASCHFHAGADSRAKNQLNPNVKNVVPDFEFGNSGIVGVPGFDGFGPNYMLTAEDFPFHVLDEPEENNFLERVVLKDTNDVTSSMGAFNADFLRVNPGELGDVGMPVPDPVFNVGNVNVRRVEPRNTPTNINAVFNFSNFWDGRAHNHFNGVSPIGPLDDDATILVNDGGVLTEAPFVAENSSLASQAVGPPLSRDEMSFNGRFFEAIGKKVVDRKPLAFQLVHPQDNVLGALTSTQVRRGKVSGPKGLNTTYAEMIMTAFEEEYWNSDITITLNPDGSRNIGGASPNPSEVFTQMEANFSLFFGLAVQAYQATLISDLSPFDEFMAGDDEALSPEQLQGLLVFLNTGAKGNLPEVDAAIAEFETGNPGLLIGAGNCISCHGGSVFSDATFPALADGDELELIEVEETAVLEDGLLALNELVEGLLDNGFSNIGVRPTNEDLGRGGVENGFPVSFSRQIISNPELLEGVIEEDDFPCSGADCPGLLVDGAFKIPTLRNVELTGPYFHNGGEATLAQVVEFYDRQSNFGDLNIDLLDRNMVFIDLEEDDEEPLVDFLVALTDDRVRKEKAPFDHPQLFVPNGSPGDEDVITCLDPDILAEYGVSQACTEFVELPAIGAAGLPAAGLPPIGTFLDLPPIDVDEGEDD